MPQADTRGVRLRPPPTRARQFQNRLYFQEAAGFQLSTLRAPRSPHKGQVTNTNRPEQAMMTSRRSLSRLAAAWA